MMIAVLVVAIACLIFWLVFLKLKLLRMTPGWVFGFSVFVVHLLLVFVIGLRFMTPISANATLVQHTIQLIPRLRADTRRGCAGRKRCTGEEGPATVPV